jgi:hypothetical protein
MPRDDSAEAFHGKSGSCFRPVFAADYKDGEVRVLTGHHLMLRDQT